MSFWPIPDRMEQDIYALSPEWFTRRGIRQILLDVDNTLAPYTSDEADERLKGWVAEMKAGGLALFILSNNKGERPAVFARQLELPFVKKAWKPFTRVAREVLSRNGWQARETAVIGDQIYTDTACAKWLGATAVLVEPIAFTNPFLRWRYGLEWPFRRIAQRRKTTGK